MQKTSNFLMRSLEMQNCRIKRWHFVWVLNEFWALKRKVNHQPFHGLLTRRIVLGSPPMIYLWVSCWSVSRMANISQLLDKNRLEWRIHRRNRRKTVHLSSPNQMSLWIVSREHIFKRTEDGHFSGVRSKALNAFEPAKASTARASKVAERRSKRDPLQIA